MIHFGIENRTPTKRIVRKRTCIRCSGLLTEQEVLKIVFRGDCVPDLFILKNACAHKTGRFHTIHGKTPWPAERNIRMRRPQRGLTEASESGNNPFLTI